MNKKRNKKTDLEKWMQREDKKLTNVVQDEDDIKANEAVDKAINEVRLWEKKCEKMGDSLPHSKAKAINFLNTRSTHCCAKQKLDFITKHPKQHESHIKREIGKIERFINNANKYEFPNVAYDRLNEIEKDMFVYQEIISNECSTYFQPYPEFTKRYIPIYGRNILFYEYLKSKIKDDNKTSNNVEAKERKIKAPVIALFCKLMNETEIISKGEKSSQVYCKEICKKFNLKYSENVRKNFFCKPTRRNISKLKELILPTVEEPTRKKISSYIDGNTKVFA